MTETSPDQQLSKEDQQKVVDLVLAKLDAHPELVSQLTALPQQTVLDVQQQLSAAMQPVRPETAAPRTTPPDIGADADPLADGANLLEAVLKAERAAEARSPTLQQLTGLGEAAVIRGEVDMGDIKAADGGVLWTRALGGCVGVAIHSSGRSFLAHYTPDLLSLRGKPSALDRTLELIGSRVAIKGARLWMSSPAQGVSYYNNLRDRLTTAGAVLQTEYTSSRIALHIEKGQVHTSFKASGGGSAHTL